MRPRRYKTSGGRLQKIRAVMTKVRRQFGQDNESVLMFSVIERAALDLIDDDYRQSAKHYLNSEMYHALMCGIEPGWIRKQLRAIGEM